MAAAFLGLFLLVAAFCAVGLFVSTLTNQPAVASIGTFAVLFVLWIIHVAGHSSSAKVSAVFSYLSLLRHFDRLLSGLFSSVDIIYYLLLIGICLILSVWRLDTLRTYR
jgi:ABC-2 type transport system permease protein